MSYVGTRKNQTLLRGGIAEAGLEASTTSPPGPRGVRQTAIHVFPIVAPLRPGPRRAHAGAGPPTARTVIA